MPKDARGHGSNSKGNSLRRVPLPGHPYHAKSNDELHYIVKDAGEAGRAAEGMGKQEHKYHDQVNDAHTVLGYRKNMTDAEAKSKLANNHPKSANKILGDKLARMGFFGKA